jgi:hypothetical protein
LGAPLALPQRTSPSQRWFASPRRDECGAVQPIAGTSCTPPAICRICQWMCHGPACSGSGGISGESKRRSGGAECAERRYAGEHGLGWLSQVARTGTPSGASRSRVRKWQSATWASTKRSICLASAQAESGQTSRVQWKACTSDSADIVRLVFAWQLGHISIGVLLHLRVCLPDAQNTRYSTPMQNRGRTP